MNREINFVDVNPRQIYEELVSDFEEALGETLYPGDERRMFLQQQVPVIVAMKNEINNTGKQNLLSYATGSNLDSLGENMYNTKRLEPQKSYCTVMIKFAKTQQTEIVVPIGTRVTGDGALFFKLQNNVTFLPGEIEKTSIVEAIETGRKYNGLIPGQLKLLVDPLPFVESIINTSITTGGADAEDDIRYSERCRLSPESFSGAGPEGAYEYHAISADSTI
ncbi:MAG: baseplate J/gp47 family protein, partial [Clostridium sp.]